MSSPVGILVVTHGEAGADMLAAVRALTGPKTDGDDALAAVTVQPGETRETIKQHLADEVRHLDAGAGVLIICDLFGSSPANCCVDLKRGGANVEVLCGLSMPMLVKLASIDRTSGTPGRLAHLAAETAVRSVRLGEGGAP